MTNDEPSTDYNVLRRVADDHAQALIDIFELPKLMVAGDRNIETVISVGVGTGATGSTHVAVASHMLPKNGLLTFDYRARLQLPGMPERRYMVCVKLQYVKF